MHIALLYTAFALIATIANIASQEMVVQVYQGPYAVVLSVLFGTATGLITKYVLDKKYIFRFRTQSAKQDSTLFILYCLTGVVTTGIFWGMEFGFHHTFGTKSMRYAGGVLGLALGYYLKFQLDRRLVFTTRGAQ